MCVPVLFVTKGVGGRITHIGGSTDDGQPWGLSEAEAVAAIDSGEWKFFVELPKGTRTPVLTKSGTTAKFLTTAPDNTTVDNLGKLPLRSPGIAGVVPAFPLSIPAATTAIGVSKLRKLEISGGHKLTELLHDPNHPSTASDEIFAVSSQMWSSSTPQWLYATCRLPFPAVYEVFVNMAQINGQIDPAADGIEQIASDDIIRRQQLEAAGKGWFSWQLTLRKPDGSPDPSAPERFSEVQIVLRPPLNAWKNQWFRVYIRPSSLNRNCSGPGVPLEFELSVPATPPSSRPAPTTGTVPSVINQILADATTALGNAGFNSVQIIGASVGQLRVDSQSPKAGDNVPFSTTIWLSVSDSSAVTGFKSLKLHNVSNSGKKLTIHSIDYQTGQWKEEGDVDFDDTLDVDLDDGHVYAIYAVDPTRPGCTTGQPTELDCVPWQSMNTFTGDDSGPDFPVDIV